MPPLELKIKCKFQIFKISLPLPPAKAQSTRLKYTDRCAQTALNSALPINIKGHNFYYLEKLFPLTKLRLETQEGMI